MWRDAVLVAGKDLRIEARSRVATNQVAPFTMPQGPPPAVQHSPPLAHIWLLPQSLSPLQPHAPPTQA